MNTFPVVTSFIDDINKSIDPQKTIIPDTTINLLHHFDDPFTTGLVAAFDFDGSITNVVLFDQEDRGAPLTVQNFLNYVEDGDYVNTIIHRSIPGFVIQGGGFTVDELVLGVIPSDPPVANEFSSERSNLRGTIAMAKLGGDPDSATSQWFFNLEDNSANLDNQNGGFTVFGEVLAQSDLNNLDAIASLPIFNGSNVFGHGALSSLPLIFDDTTNPILTGDENFVRYNNITVVQQPELDFLIVNNTNTSLVNPTISNNQLVLDYVSNQVGTAEITIRAIDLAGDFVEDTFTVTIRESQGATPGDDELFGTPLDDKLAGSGGNDTLFGGDGKDTLYGGDSADKLFGQNHDDTLNGGAGNDTLNGGLGLDNLTGEAGSDRFALRSGVTADRDIILDYQEGVDFLKLTGSLTFSDLEIAQVGADTEIRETATNEILATLISIDALTIDSSDFV